jgi:DNA-3-methyladenine glycosylase
LGKIFVKEEESGEIYAGRIVEVEAYDGNVDEASHTFRGKTARNEVMFNKGGYLYVYFTYGAHFCANVVTGREGHGTGILIRGIEPIEGIENMSLNRFGKSEISEKEKKNLTNGPGKICKAFSIDKKLYGIDLTGDRVYLLNQPKINDEDLVIDKRIGISKSIDLPWRFYIKNNKYVSRL